MRGIAARDGAEFFHGVENSFPRRGKSARRIQDGGEEAADGVEEEEAGRGAQELEGDGPFPQHAAGEEFGAGDAGEESAIHGRSAQRAVDLDGEGGDGGFGNLVFGVVEKDVVVAGEIGFGILVDAAVRRLVAEEDVGAVDGTAGERDAEEGAEAERSQRLRLERRRAVFGERQAEPLRLGGQGADEIFDVRAEAGFVEGKSK